MDYFIGQKAFGFHPRKILICFPKITGRTGLEWHEGE